MAEWTVHLPGKGSEFVTAREAGAYLGVSASTFVRTILPRFPWVTAIQYSKRLYRYRTMQVLAMKVLIEAGAVVIDGEPGQPGEK